MSGYNLPDNWSWRAYCFYYGDPEEPEDAEPVLDDEGFFDEVPA